MAWEGEASLHDDTFQARVIMTYVLRTKAVLAILFASGGA